MSIQFIDLKAQYQHLKADIDARIHAVLDHGQYIMGPEVKEVEQGLAEYTGAKHAIGVCDGTKALLIAMMALDIGPGDEVITTPFTFIATGEMIALLGAKPVFVDIDPISYNLDPALLEAAITPRTRAIMPVSLYGQCADFDAINAIAAKHGIAVIEDGAQSFGAGQRGKKSGNLSTIGCTSFFPSKPWAATATAAPASPMTTRWPRKCARSACMARTAAITTPSSVSTVAWTPYRPLCCWPSCRASPTKWLRASA